MTWRTASIGAVIVLAGAAFGNIQAPVRSAEPASGHGYSTLGKITQQNVHTLRGAWLDHLENGATSRAQESTPVAVGGILYVQTAQGDVFAINGATGKVDWDYNSGFPGIERGVAVDAGKA